jgi:virulence-associated protein VagC
VETARLFKNGQSQAVRLPKDFRFEGEKVFITRTRGRPCSRAWTSSPMTS